VRITYQIWDMIDINGLIRIGKTTAIYIMDEALDVALGRNG